MVTNVPGPVGLPGADGAAGATGPQGPAASLATHSVYGSSSIATYQLASASVLAAAALLNLNPTPPSVVLADAGTYLLFARARFDGAGLTLTTQTLTVYLYDTGVPGVIANTTRKVVVPALSAVTCTVAEVVLPAVAYVAAAGATIQLWGVMSAVTGAGTIACVEADILAIKIA